MPDRGPLAPAWKRWTALFDENGYEATVLQAADHPGAAGEIADLLDTGRAPVVVGHGAGAAVAIAAAHRPTARRWGPPAAQTHRDVETATRGERKVLGAAIALSPTRTSRFGSPPAHRTGRPPWAARRHRLPEVPVLLVVGGRQSSHEQRTALHLEEKLRRAARDDVTDRQVFSGLGQDLPVGEGWRDVAYFVLDWLTRQDL